MKLVITTQIRENYGAHDWDGQGQCPQYWKCKGGRVYVMANITPRQAARITANGIPYLTALISSRDDGYEETVIDWSIRDDLDPVCADWETAISLSYVAGGWQAELVTDNGEYGYMRPEIARKIESWTMMPGGERKNYRCLFIMRKDGRMVNYAELEQLLAA